MTQRDVELHGVAPQVDVTVLEAHLFIGKVNIARQEWQLLRYVQNAQLFRDQFHFSGGNVFVDGVGVALLHRSDHRNNELVAQSLSLVMHGGIQFVVEHHLSDAAAVAQIDEDNLAKIAAAVHPSHQDNFFARVGETQSPAHVSSP